MSNEQKQIPAYTEESETEDSLAAKRSYFHDKDISVPLAKAWEAGCAYGWSTAKIPWKKQDERPDKDREIICVSPLKVLYVGPCDYSTKGEWGFHSKVGFLWWSEMSAWCYFDELPLPEWVKK